MYKIIAAKLLLLLSISVVTAQQNDWTHFRGTNLDGISAEKQPPVMWNDSTNISWKIKSDGKGWSSPVVFGNQVWITSASSDGKQMFALCYDFASGKQLFKVKLFEPSEVFGKHDFNTYATPTPCIEKDFVWVHFGTYGTTCLKTSDGSVAWSRKDLNCNHVQGPGSSPIIYKNLLILHIEGTDVQYITALDKKTGKTIWKTDRPKELYDPLKAIGKKAYITPLIVTVGGKDLLISNGSAVIIAYDPLTGKEVWRIVQGEDSTIAMPSAENGLVFFYTAFVTPKEGEQYCELMAVDPSGKGDITKTHILWRMKAPILQLSTQLVKDGLIYTVDSDRKLFCIEAKTGKIVYEKRLNKKYNSSPLAAGGKIYFTSTDGETMVIKEGRNYEEISKNKLHGEVYATPAILRNSILLRTSDYLYKITGN